MRAPGCFGRYLCPRRVLHMLDVGLAAFGRWAFQQDIEKLVAVLEELFLRPEMSETAVLWEAVESQGTLALALRLV